jgi:hypothetical protein
LAHENHIKSPKEDKMTIGISRPTAAIAAAILVTAGANGFGQERPNFNPNSKGDVTTQR